VAFTHPEKRLFPSGFTKGEVIQYYLHVAPHLLPHLRDRPITLIRFPDGTHGESFYEKNAPGFAPEWIRTFPVPRREHEGSINYILVNDPPTLAWCANLAALEFHPFLHRVPALERPTHVAFDLDPGEGADLLTCIEVAQLLRALCDELGLKLFPKVSGSKGLQLYVPLNTEVTYDATQPFAKAMAELLERRHPQLIVSRMPKALRHGRVLIDWSQNSAAKTTVAVYSLRAKRDAPFVSMPVEWRELERAHADRDAASLSFTPDAALQRLQRRGDLFAPVLKLKQQLPAAFRELARRPARHGPLQRYAEKRDFARTAEPAPAPPRRSRQGSTRRFVIQKHAASHLHYDFRLEMGGTLKSWAVPKGVPYELGVRRSAFQVEDHPIDYLEFEGTIPQGQYGGGTVMVWDIGTYELIDGNYGKGDLKLWLDGRKLRGEWHLFRIKSEESKPVWLIQKAGEPMRALTARQDDRSAVSGRSLAKIAADNDAQWQSNRGRAAEARARIRASTAAAAPDAAEARTKTKKAGGAAPADPSAAKPVAKPKPPAAKPRRGHAPVSSPQFVEPAQPVLVAALPDGPEWRYEIKWDGFRALALKAGDQVQLLSRRHNSLAAEFAPIVAQLRALPGETFLLDGEIVALTADGKPSFQALQQRGSRAATLVYYAFDLLHVDGQDLAAAPLTERQERLEQLVVGTDVRVSRALEGDAATVLAAVRRLGLEGVVAKRRDAPYPRGGSDDWQKVRLSLAQEFVIGGFKPGMQPFESVLVGYYEAGRLRFAGKVRPGFRARSRDEVWRLIEPLQVDTCPFVDLPDAERKGPWGEGITAEDMQTLRWVKPEIVVRVSFTEWTRHGHLRHAAFEGLRADKSPREVVREQAAESTGPARARAERKRRTEGRR
jgi:bifunctional non-homologous end joining protein LigD